MWLVYEVCVCVVTHFIADNWNVATTIPILYDYILILMQYSYDCTLMLMIDGEMSVF